MRGWRLRAARSPALVFLLWLGWQYARRRGADRPHVEYAGIIPYLEQLAASSAIAIW